MLREGTKVANPLFPLSFGHFELFQDFKLFFEHDLGTRGKRGPFSPIIGSSGNSILRGCDSMESAWTDLVDKGAACWPAYNSIIF